MTTLSVSLLGSFEAVLNEVPLTQFRTRSVQALLVYLLCEPEVAHGREGVMALLWPNVPLQSAQANLRQTVYRLRQLIPEVAGKDGKTAVSFILSTRQTIQINPLATYTLDVDQFLHGDDETAVSLYRGEFLTDFYLPDSAPFEAWLLNQRTLLRQRVLALLDAQTAVSLENNQLNQAAELAQRAIDIDPLRESSHRHLMTALAKNGRRQDALAHFSQLSAQLNEELAIAPEPETVALLDAIRAGALSPQAPAFVSEPARKHNLPQPLTSFVGREKEITAVTNLITQNRLVMLTGAGGIGKTNLCLRIGRTLLDTFSDGVWLIELAAITDPEAVAKTAVYALGLRQPNEQSNLETVNQYLLGKNCLLILDNCEHVIDSAAQFVETILQANPDVKILASSRESLSIPGEIPYRVPPLSLPNKQQLPTIDNWTEYDALRLFAERAKVVMPTFQVTEETLLLLIHICQRLDGIPLAIELASARLGVLTLPQIVDRLDNRFRLLTGGSRTALPRQQTLRALIDWSWELLTEREQQLLGQLSVFADSFCLESAEAVCDPSIAESFDLLDGLSELVNKSLLIAVRTDKEERRYHFLETIRHYAQEKLIETGSSEQYRQAHLCYFSELGEEASQALIGPDQVMWLNRLDQELDNIRSALGWALETNVEKGLRLANGIWKFWEARGYGREGEKWLGKLLSASTEVDPTVRAKSLVIQSVFNHSIFELPYAKMLVQEALSIYQSLADKEGIAHSLHVLAWINDMQDEHEQSYQYFLESLALYREADNKIGQADSLSSLGTLAGNSNNEYSKAMSFLKQGLALYKEMGHLAGVASVLNTSGMLALRQGHYEAARLWLEESLSYRKQLEGDMLDGGILSNLGELYTRLEAYDCARDYLLKSIDISKQTGHRLWLYWSSVRLGFVYLSMGELELAEPLFCQCQHWFQEASSSSGLIYATEGMAGVAFRRSQWAQALRLYAWSDGMRNQSQDPRPPSEQADVQRELAVIREQLGDGFTAVYQSGRLITVDELMI